MDLSKAFDVVSHHKLFVRLHCYGIRDTLGHFIFPLKLSFKLGFRPKFGLKPN